MGDEVHPGVGCGLENVCDLVREQALSALGRRVVLAAAEEYVRANREGSGLDVRSCSGGCIIGMDIGINWPAQLGLFIVGGRHRYGCVGEPLRLRFCVVRQGAKPDARISGLVLWGR
jgi:hypothetical protein